MYRRIDTAYFVNGNWPKNSFRCRALLRIMSHLREENGATTEDLLYYAVNPKQKEFDIELVRKRIATLKGNVVPCASHPNCDVCCNVPVTSPCPSPATTRTTNQ